VNIYALLNKLIDLNVNRQIVILLEYWLANSAACVKFDNNISKCINLSARVRQGGILSPFLFSLYVDIVLQRLSDCKLGCFVDGLCYNSFMYADDLILLSHSVMDLQSLFDLCSNTLHMVDLPINIDKCHCMRVGPRHNSICKNITIKGINIVWVNEIKYLGIIIKKGKSFCCNWDSSVKNFYSTSNTILAKLGATTSVDVALHLLKAQSVPHLTYGTAAKTLSDSDVKRLSFVYNSMFVKLFETKDNSVIQSCQFFSSVLHLLNYMII